MANRTTTQDPRDLGKKPPFDEEAFVSMPWAPGPVGTLLIVTGPVLDLTGGKLLP
jgi:hypothetical protein